MYELCMRYKCKLCPKSVECENQMKEHHLMYKPFEKLNEILEQKYGDKTQQYNLY
jgi:hypothetical protein